MFTERARSESPSEVADSARQKAERWLAAYARAWEALDPEAAAALYSEDATYQETPFSEPMRGRDAIHAYWSHVAETQQDVRFEFQLLHAATDACIAHWSASFLRVPPGKKLKLDGIFLLAFGPDGRCRSLREWWVKQESE